MRVVIDGGTRVELFSTEILTELSLVLGLFGGVVAAQYFFLERSLSQDIENIEIKREADQKLVEHRLDSIESNMRNMDSKLDRIIVHLLEKGSPGDI